MTPLPLPVRLAAGLVATAVEQARHLPRLVIEFPVTAVSQALQVSMRVQQRVTELAIKGDRALGALRPVEEQPGWATFDEDEPRSTNGATTVTALRPSPRPPARPVAVERPEPPATAAEAVELIASAPLEQAAASPTAPVLPGYATMSIAQLRGKLRSLRVDQLQALLAWERTHDDRPPYVTMLANRIITVSEG